MKVGFAPSTAAGPAPSVAGVAGAAPGADGSVVAAQEIEEIRTQNFELQKYLSEKMYNVPVVTPVEFAARQPTLKGVVNASGPTTYAVGTEATLTNWLDV